MKASELCKLQAKERIKKEGQSKGLHYLGSCLKKIEVNFLHSPNAKAFTTNNQRSSDTSSDWYFGIIMHDPEISDREFTERIVGYPLLVDELIKLGYKINIEKKVLMRYRDEKVVTGKRFFFFNTYETKSVPDERTKETWSEVTVQICCKETK